MIRRLLPFLAILYSVLMLCGCSEHEYNEEGLMSGTSLTISFKSADVRMDTRGIEDLDDNGTVSELEEIVDGRHMYRLAVFLVRDGAVVESAVLEEGDVRMANGNTEATVSFDNLDYSKPYQLYAVANYGDYGTQASGHLTSVTDVTGSMQVASSASSALCPKSTPYPLTLKKEIALQPGMNTVSGELVRTYARVRINIRNQSKADLQITDLSFANRFTQSTAPLFEEGGTANAKPTVTSSDAVTPFVKDMIIPGIGEGNSVTESTIFDAYMLESNGGQYQYTLGLKYGGGVTETVYSVDQNYITNPSSVVNGGLYVVYNSNANKYLYDNGSNNLSSATSYMTNGELNHNCVWRFIRTSGDSYRIESMGRSGYYIRSSAVKNNAVPMTSTPGNNDYFTLSQSGSYSSYMYMRSTSSNYYLAVNNNGPVGASSGNSRRFRLYRVNATTVNSDVSRQATIPVTTVDKQTGESVPMQSIRRNDFVNIVVNVSYNEKSGEIEFEVSDWDEVEGDITFD